MKILSILIFNLSNTNPTILSSAFSLSSFSFMIRKEVKEFLIFHSRLVIERVAPESNSQVKLEKGICYAISFLDKIGISMICDDEYPKRVAIDFLLKIYDNFKSFIKEKNIDISVYTDDTNLKFEYIKTGIDEWQDPTKKDNLMMLQNELNEVKNIMVKNIEELMNRGESLESLIKKSKDLSETSKNYYDQSKRTNRCCNL